MEFPIEILDALKGFCKKILEEMMIEERANYLKENLQTKANGFYSRGLSSMICGKIEDLHVPRTRDGAFQSLILPKRKVDESIELLSSLLFKAGVSTRNIESILLKCFGTSISHTSISYLSRVTLEEIKKWKNRQFSKEYAAVFIDAFFFPLKRKTVDKEAVYVALGITPEGRREVLDFWIPGGSEGASNWEEILNEIKFRGTSRIDFIVADGLQGIKEAIFKVFPKSNYQYCILHATRTTLNKIRASQKSEMSIDLKKIYYANSREEADQMLNYFIKKWQKEYPKVTDLWERNFQYLMSYMELPSGLRRYVYTTNWVERLHKEIKRRLKTMEQFQNEESAQRILYMLYSQQNEKYKNSGVNGWRMLYSDYLVRKEKNIEKIVEFVLV